MPKNRQAFESLVIATIEKIAPGSANAAIYKRFFERMNDKQFDQYVQDLRSGAKFLVLQQPNFSSKKISVENNLAIGKALGHDFFTPLFIEGKDGAPSYQTPVKYLVMDEPVRLASQSLTKKMSVPDNMKVVDSLTGQVTGDSQGAKISYPELRVCAAMGLHHSMVELVKYRAGDVKGGAALRTMLSTHGRAPMSVLKNFAGEVRSKSLARSYLTSAMLRSTL